MLVERNVRIGYFSQDVGEMAGRSVVEETIAGAGEVAEIGAELKQLEIALADPERMDELERNIERVCWVEDVEEVDIVGVSLGGLTALYYQHFTAARRRIRKLVALGTPFSGSDYARGHLPTVGLISAGIWQVLPDR